MLLLAGSLMLGSCNDWLTEDAPGSNKIEDYFVSSATAIEVVNAT